MILGHVQTSLRACAWHRKGNQTLCTVIVCQLKLKTIFPAYFKVLSAVNGKYTHTHTHTVRLKACLRAVNFLFVFSGSGPTCH